MGLTSDTRAESVLASGSSCGASGANVEPGPGRGFFLVNLTEIFSEYPSACERIVSV